MSRADFEVLVSEALDEVPPELAALIDNVAIFVEDEPPTGDPQLLGIYEGIPLTERGRLLRRRSAGPDHDLPQSDPGDLRHRRGRRR